MNLSARTLTGLIGAGFATIAIAQGCSPTGKPNTFGTTSTTNGAGGAGGAGGAAQGTGGDGEGGTILTTSATGTGSGDPGCQGGTPEDDHDADGFSETEGDCNDCDKFVNPNAVEVIAEPDDMGNTPPAVDEDCDGTKDNVLSSCDDGLAQNSMDPLDGAKAIGLCKFVKEARWVLADGSPPPVEEKQLANFHKGHGILDNLGPKNPPQEGKRILVVSSGTARKEGDPEYVHRNFDKGYNSNPPFGFPKESASCGSVVTEGPHDATGLEVEITAPSNAQGISFDFNFFTFEWPKYICTSFNDFFVANLVPFPPGQTDGNISFDAQKNPISVNNAFLDICGCPAAAGPPCPAPPTSPTPKKFDCALGKDTLAGTDFDSDDGNPGWTNGATGWLRTSAPVVPGEVFKIRFVTYDSSDGSVDSTTLIDNWKWSAKPGSVNTDVVPK